MKLAARKSTSSPRNTTRSRDSGWSARKSTSRRQRTRMNRSNSEVKCENNSPPPSVAKVPKNIFEVYGNELSSPSSVSSSSPRAHRGNHEENDTATAPKGATLNGKHKEKSSELPGGDQGGTTPASTAEPEPKGNHREAASPSGSKRPLASVDAEIDASSKKRNCFSSNILERLKEIKERSKKSAGEDEEEDEESDQSSSGSNQGRSGGAGAAGSKHVPKITEQELRNRLKVPLNHLTKQIQTLKEFIDMKAKALEEKRVQEAAAMSSYEKLSEEVQLKINEFMKIHEERLKVRRSIGSQATPSSGPMQRSSETPTGVVKPPPSPLLKKEPGLVVEGRSAPAGDHFIDLTKEEELAEARQASRVSGGMGTSQTVVPAQASLNDLSKSAASTPPGRSKPPPVITTSAKPMISPQAMSTSNNYANRAQPNATVLPTMLVQTTTTTIANSATLPSQMATSRPGLLGEPTGNTQTPVSSVVLVSSPTPPGTYMPPRLNPALQSISSSYQSTPSYSTIPLPVQTVYTNENSLATSTLQQLATNNTPICQYETSQHKRIRPAPKPTLTVENSSEGIKLTWDMEVGTGEYADVKSYEIFSSKGDGKYKANWSKVGEVQSLPLPMVVTLNHIEKSIMYNFVVRAVYKDRKSEFSNIEKTLG